MITDHRHSLLFILVRNIQCHLMDDYNNIVYDKDFSLLFHMVYSFIYVNMFHVPDVPFHGLREVN